MRKVPCDVYSRVVGYFQPVSQWNKGKQAEFRDRVTYKVGDNKVHIFPLRDLLEVSHEK